MPYILITGVSSGIGYRLTKNLITKGFFVFGSVRDQRNASILQQQFGDRFKSLIFDVRDQKALDRSRKEVVEILGENRLQALINNAGINVHGPLEYLPISEIKEQFDVNVFGALRVTQTFLQLISRPINRDAVPGVIINISSISGKITTPFMTPYCASKFALESFTDGLRRELTHSGIKVVAVRPGPVESEIWNKAKKDGRKYQGTPYEGYFKRKDELIDRFKSKTISDKKLVSTIHRIITSDNPKPNYLLTPNPMAYWLQRYLPTVWLDYVYKRLFQRI